MATNYRAFELTFHMENAVFEYGNATREVARILRSVANRIENENILIGKIMDINGNSIGSFKKKGFIV